MRRVLITYTGGTIGMKPTRDGYAPEAGYLTDLMNAMPELQHETMPLFDVYEYDPLLDSANMRPTDWLKLAKHIATNYDAYDGFVILHGTDTMAYTASVLSFLLKNLSKSVIITGSQIPITEVRSDAREQLITAMQLAGQLDIPEVCVYFGGRLLRGNRAVKVDATGLSAFDSPNYPPLALIGVDIEVYWDRILPMPDDPLYVYDVSPQDVGAMRLFPGMSAQVVRNFLLQPLQGFIIETYGVGNAPQDPDFLAALKSATDRGVVVVNCTQCLHGTVRMDKYQTGNNLQQAGVVSGFDLTPMAALTKLFFLLSQGLPVDEVRRQMMISLRGELTRPEQHAPTQRLRIVR